MEAGAPPGPAFTGFQSSRIARVWQQISENEGEGMLALMGKVGCVCVPDLPQWVKFHGPGLACIKGLLISQFLAKGSVLILQRS